MKRFFACIRLNLHDPNTTSEVCSKSLHTDYAQSMGFMFQVSLDSELDYGQDRTG